MSTDKVGMVPGLRLVHFGAHEPEDGFARVAPVLVAGDAHPLAHARRHVVALEAVVEGLAPRLGDAAWPAARNPCRHHPSRHSGIFASPPDLPLTIFRTSCLISALLSRKLEPRPSSGLKFRHRRSLWSASRSGGTWPAPLGASGPPDPCRSVLGVELAFRPSSFRRFAEQGRRRGQIGLSILSSLPLAWRHGGDIASMHAYTPRRWKLLIISSILVLMPWTFWVVRSILDRSLDFGPVDLGHDVAVRVEQAA